MMLHDARYVKWARCRRHGVSRAGLQSFQPKLRRSCRRLRAAYLCYSASMRAGRTKTTSFSLDDVTLKNLKALAARRHDGNVSALLAEVATREAKFAAAEAYFDK